MGLEVSTQYTYAVGNRSVNGSAKSFDGPPAWQTFTEDDGLGNNTVTSVYQSSDGAMWFGTFGGGRYVAGAQCGG